LEKKLHLLVGGRSSEIGGYKHKDIDDEKILVPQDVMKSLEINKSKQKTIRLQETDISIIISNINKTPASLKILTESFSKESNKLLQDTETKINKQIKLLTENPIESEIQLTISELENSLELFKLIIDTKGTTVSFSSNSVKRHYNSVILTLTEAIKELNEITSFSDSKVSTEDIKYSRTQTIEALKNLEEKFGESVLLNTDETSDLSIAQFNLWKEKLDIQKFEERKKIEKIFSANELLKMADKFKDLKSKNTDKLWEKFYEKLLKKIDYQLRLLRLVSDPTVDIDAIDIKTYKIGAFGAGFERKDNNRIVLNLRKLREELTPEQKKKLQEEFNIDPQLIGLSKDLSEIFEKKKEVKKPDGSPKDMSVGLPTTTTTTPPPSDPTKAIMP